MPLTKSCDFSGTMDGVDILDVVHFMLLNRQKMLLDIRSFHEDLCRLYIVDGNIVHAVGDNLKGLEAFMACMSFRRRGTFPVFHGWSLRSGPYSNPGNCFL